MRVVLPIAVAGLSAVILVHRLQAQSADPDLAGELVVASRIYALAQHYFAHWDGVARADVDVAYRRYVSDVLRATDRRAFDLATLRFVASFRNGHTQFVDTQADGRPLRFRLLEVENQWVVVASQDSGLRRGSIVQTIDDKPVAAVVNELAQYVAASNDRLARTHVFSYPILFGERISIRLKNGQVVVVDRSVQPDATAPFGFGTEGRWLREGQIAYIRVPTFGDQASEGAAVDLVHRFTTAPNLIVDVRGNGGGSTPRELINVLMNQPWRTWQESTPQQIALLEANGVPPLQASRPSREQAPSSSAYAGRLFVLTDRFCGSACEDFLMPLSETQRAVVIGETTQGSSGNPYRADLSNGMRIAIGAVRYRFPDGRPFEGLGIVPDVPIERTIADLQSGRDAALDRAVQLASDK
jgi:carboxyl-terminal processing protease